MMLFCFRKTLGLISLFFILSAPSYSDPIDDPSHADGISSPADTPDPLRIPSPNGKCDIAFIADKPLSGESLKHIRYIVRFYTPGQQTVIAETNFVDVYGQNPGGKPTPIRDLVKQMLWSPQNDVAFLPREQWPPERTLKPRQAVSLDPSSSWQTADFLLEDSPLAWIDRSHVIGNQVARCQKTVGQFDALSGKTQPVVQVSAPYGYEILSISDRLILMKKVLDDCAKPGDEKTFVPECSALDTGFMRQHIIPCP